MNKRSEINERLKNLADRVPENWLRGIDQLDEHELFALLNISLCTNSELEELNEVVADMECPAKWMMGQFGGAEGFYLFPLIVGAVLSYARKS